MKQIHAISPVTDHDREPSHEEQAVPVAESMGRLLAFPTALDPRTTESRSADATHGATAEPVLRLGEALLQRGLITEQTLQETLEEAERTGAVLGQLLVAHGHVHRLDLYRVLSEIWGVETCDLLETPPDAALIERLGLAPEVMAGLSWLPVAATDDHLRVASMERPSPRLEHDIRRLTGWTGEITVDVTTEWDLRASLLRLYGADLTRVAASRLRDTSPEDSAARVLVNSQILCLLAALAGAVTLLLAYPSSFLFGLFCVLNVCYAGLVWFKTAAIGTGLVRHATGHSGGERTAYPPVPDTDLPVYTVLVPAFGEANVIVELIEHLGELDYPRDRARGAAAARGGRPPDHRCGTPGRHARRFFRIVVVPDGEPRTKPKACNVGLGFARGEFLVIFDAEDRPEPDQLRKACGAVPRRRTGAGLPPGPPQLLQLGREPPDPVVHTRVLALVRPAAGSRRGCGCRCRSAARRTTSAPRRCASSAAWDPYNVTEDADLGLRAAAKGYRVGTLDSTTYEEACCRTVPWIKPAHAVDQGLHADRARAHAAPDPVRPRRRPARRGDAAVPGRGHTARVPRARRSSGASWPSTWSAGHAPAIGFGGSLMVTIAAVNLLIGNGADDRLLGHRRAAAPQLPPGGVRPADAVVLDAALARRVARPRPARARPSYWEKTPHGLSKKRPPCPVIPLTPARPEQVTDAA